MVTDISRRRIATSVAKAARFATAVAFISMALPATAVACDRWVTKSGNDSGTGSAASPFRTIQRAADLANPGQTICVAGGVYSERVQIYRSGQVGSPILFQADGSVRTRGFTVRADNVEINGFEVTDTPSNWPDVVGIYIHGTGVSITDNYVHETGSDGIYCEGYYPYCNGALISGNVVRYATGSGMLIAGTAARVEGNEVSHSRMGWGDADGVRFFGTQHVLVNNWIHDITESLAPGAHTDCFQTFDNDQEPTTDILIAGNVCERIDHQCLIATAVTQRQSQSLRFESNFCDTNGSQGVLLMDFRDVHVLGNTFGPSILYHGVMAQQGSTGVTLSSNIFYGWYMHYFLDQSSLAGSLADRNLKYPGSFTRWAEPNGLWDVDPLFVNMVTGDFRLRDGSPAIDANYQTLVFGLDASGLPRSVDGDCDGNVRSDLGAFERGPESCVPGYVFDDDFESGSTLKWSTTL